jgi:predicted small lipoprotein YifL
LGLIEMMSWVRAILAVSALAFALGGCGLRGGLETPPEAKADATAEAQSGQGKPEGAAPKPHKGSILDGLIR